MTKKIMIGLTSLVLMAGIASTSMANLSWLYTGDLSTWDATVQSGWLVQMYQDVDANTVVGNISAVNAAGALTGTGANTSDDTLLGSFTATTAVSAKGGLMQWGNAFASWGSLYSANVYSVLYNAASVGTHTKAVVVDASPATLAASDPYEYSIGSVGNNWVAVPEPTTLAFMGLGLGALLLRKRMRK